MEIKIQWSFDMGCQAVMFDVSIEIIGKSFRSFNLMEALVEVGIAIEYAKPIMKMVAACFEAAELTLEY